jgi:hypothetical protein
MIDLNEAGDGMEQTAPVWAVFGDLMSGLLGAFVLILVGVLVVQMDLVASLESEMAKRRQEEQRRMALEKALAIPLASGRVTLANGRIGISGSVLFAVNSDQLRPDGRQLLKSLVPPLQVYLGERDEMLMVSGFTDNKPISEGNRRFEDNLELSAPARADRDPRPDRRRHALSARVRSRLWRRAAGGRQHGRCRSREKPAGGNGARGPFRPGETRHLSAMDLLDASPQQHAPPAYQVRLDALRKAAQRIDPVRMHYLDVLSQRIATAPEAVQRVLENTLDTALTELESTPSKSRNRPHAMADEAPRPAAPLVALNQIHRGL